MNGTLIRDKLPERIKASGDYCNYAIIQTDELFRDLIRDKLAETTQRFLNTNSVEDLCELMMVVNTIGAEAQEAFNATYAKQFEEFGGYDNRYVWLQSSRIAAENTAARKETN